jgi:hypothetical protein
VARLAACLSSIAIAALGCGGSDLVLPTDVGPPAAITMVRGDAQTGAPGTPLADSIVVKVTDSAGNPVPNQQVVFTLASAAPGAAVTPQSATTGADGTASARWTLGQAAGTQEVVAQVIGQSLSANLTVRFTASATAPPPAIDRLELRTQPSASVTIGVDLARQPVIQLRDAEGNDLSRSGVSVTAAVASGGGTLTGTTTRVSGSDGRVEFTDLRITGATGPHVLIFAADGYTSVTSDPVDVQPAEVPPPGSNQPPVAGDDEYNSIEGYEHILTVGAGAGVLQNDSDPEGGPLTASHASDPPHGHVSMNADGSFSYGPEPSFFGDDRFTYRVQDEQGNASTATVTIHVAPVNDRPRFIRGPNVKVSADAGPVSISGWVKDISPGADNESDQILTFEVSNDNPGLFTSGGQPAVTREGPQSRRATLSFTPSGATGTARVTVVLRDNGGGADTSEPQSFTITVKQ